MICEYVISLSEVSKICHDALSKEYDGVKFNLKDMPYAVAWLASLVNPFAAMALARWKRKDTYSMKNMNEILGIKNLTPPSVTLA